MGAAPPIFPLKKEADPIVLSVDNVTDVTQ